MAFVPGQGYGQFFTYSAENIRGDGFEVKHFAGTIMRQAIGQLIFARALNESRDAFGKGRGGTFTTPIVNNWGEPGTVQPLTSGTAIGIGSQTTDKIEMNLYEYGTGVGYEGLGDYFTDLPFQAEVNRTLSIHISRMVNWLHYDILANTDHSIEVVATGSYAKLLGTNRKRSGVGTSFGELGWGGVALAYDTFRTSLASPVTERGFYVMFGNSETFRNLKQGSVFQNAQLYTDLRGLRWQILGEFQNFVFVETEELLRKGTAIAVAANAGGYGFGQLPRTWYYPDYGNDAGRLSVWKTKFVTGQGGIWRDRGTAAIMIRSKTTTFDYGQMDM